MADLSWMDRAACRGMDTEIFFADNQTAVEFARGICRRCPVRPECLQYALDRPDTFGVWGGKSKYQRTRMGEVPRQRPKRTVARGGMAAVNAKKTHCKNGHEFTPENTAVYNGKRSCRMCYQKRLRDKRKSRRAVST